MKTNPPILHSLIAAFLALATTQAFASGPHDATLFVRGTSKTGAVIWKGSSKVYVIRDARGVSISVPFADVQGIRLTKQPPNLKSAVSSGNIPQLQKIMEAYEMFGPDQVAAQALVQAYVRQNQAKKAVTLCESLFRKNPGMKQNAQVQSAYWEALRKSDQKDRLRRALIDALQNGDRKTQAAACLERGHLEREEGDMRKALVDGYLRCVVMYQNVKAIQPEALYWAFKCHQTLNENNYAERWRTRLTSEYPTSAWTKKLGSG